ncbi:Putative_reverse transcriptase/endonuclease [Hexamita inflata]|uniref:Reverse transcriptase/endonuclease n=1 Tax=Hexamita inflata TaxID=28002 RepID=A0AA86UTQ6_9EUKA|nr:Putative reverse transcriptase/endonuclease [Hexamita inflata]CAI9949393.1 Putative reverse transcriptase/endonuclease [Hexamita inflata]
MDPITEDEIKSIILRIKKGKSSGDDGLTGSHLKYLVYQHEHFLKILEFFFNQLLSNPAHLQDCKQLFRFRAILLPKKSGGLRPVSCESMILAVFSSCLKTRLMQQVDIHEHQFCFKSGVLLTLQQGLNNSKFRAKRQPQPIVQTRTKLQTIMRLCTPCNFKESILFLLSTTAPIQTRGAVNTQIHLLQACRLVIVSVHWHSASV